MRHGFCKSEVGSIGPIGCDALFRDWSCCVEWSMDSLQGGSQFSEQIKVEVYDNNLSTRLESTSDWLANGVWFMVRSALQG